MYEMQRDILHEQGYTTAFRDQNGEHYLEVVHVSIPYHFKGRDTVKALFDGCHTISGSTGGRGFVATFRLNPNTFNL